MADDYFDLFGLRPAIDLDLGALNQKYLALQSEFHPDKFVGRSEVEKTTAMEKSAKINKAYGVLKDRFKRAEYLLGELKADNETLMEVMELRENQDRETVGKVREQVGKLFNSMTVDYTNGERDAAVKKFVKIKYFNKFLEDVAANS